MPLNKSKGNMYSFISHTWNGIKGECSHGCSYCYMTRFPQKAIRLDEKEFKTNLGEGNFIFVGSSCDMFAPDIPFNWVFQVIEYCKRFDNKYLFQTKNPESLYGFNDLYGLPKNSVICTTIESNRDFPDIMNQSPAILDRVKWMSKFELDKYVTIEPVLNFDLHLLVQDIKKINPKQVNIGADTGRNNLPEPSKLQIKMLIKQLSEFTIVNQKKNLKRLLK